MDRSPRRSRRIYRQYRRLPDALDERRLCFNPASRRQSKRGGAVLYRVFLRPESGRDGRNNPELREGGRGWALSADLGRRLSENASGCEQAGGGRSGGRLTHFELPPLLLRRGGEAVNGRRGFGLKTNLYCENTQAIRRQAIDSEMAPQPLGIAQNGLENGIPAAGRLEGKR